MSISNFKVTVRRAGIKNIENDTLEVSNNVDFKITMRKKKILMRKKVDNAHKTEINVERIPASLMRICSPDPKG